ncbi:hypothetical protein B0I35DRAFT_25412 [Stachybotrys elegans]|uniref:ML-like domain-containing protein n=1 Tax=Stachybotrys elegans TaxID=80388 RepID=A0A8K0WWI9_9HYPO|nr:hypothetical protein B0I35DRAFT_25412 [Stachybotrys elegans]
MAHSGIKINMWRTVLLLGAFASAALGDDILRTDGFTNCMDNNDIKVEKVNIGYNNSNKTVNFDVAGSSTREQRVKAVIKVTAYGNSVYENEFNPCDQATFVQQLCPVPVGRFSAFGEQAIPAEYTNLVPGIAFQFPDIAAQATLELQSLDGQNVACIQSHVSNGRTANLPAVSYVTAGIMGVALVASGVSAVGAALSGAGGAGAGPASSSPGFTEMVGWFQGLAMNGMMSVNYPPIYRSFTSNFAFSTGIIPWTQLQRGIDDFRSRTGGDLSNDSVDFLQGATLVFPDNSTATPSGGFRKRGLENLAVLLARQAESGGESEETRLRHVVSGVQGYVEKLAVPESNVFMTILLVVAIVVATIIVGILLVKLVLEGWALFGNFPQSLAGFRKHYWGTIARSITSLVFLLYGIWVLYCVFQFTRGDSWAAKVLAGVTLGVFTGILAFFTYKIWATARKLKESEGSADGLYDDKSTWMKYSIFYESYRKDCWWLFVPFIAYMMFKGIALAGLDSKGMTQTITVLVIEGLMLILLLWSRPFERRSGNVINIIIQVVRVLSIACILVFVEELGVEQTTQTVTGIALIVIQSTLTGVLAILIIWNAINACCKANPHRKRRKEMEKMQKDMDNLTPLDPRNSITIDAPGSRSLYPSPSGHEKSSSFSSSLGDYGMAEKGMSQGLAPSAVPMYRPLTPSMPNDARQPLVQSAAPFSTGGVASQYQASYGYSNQGYNQPAYRGY